MYRRQEPIQKNTIKIEGELFDHAEVVLFNRPYCKLKRKTSEMIWASQKGNTHDFRGIYAGTYDFYPNFRVVFDNLLVGEIR
jgi:hypothetical protein